MHEQEQEIYTQQKIFVIVKYNVYRKSLIKKSSKVQVVDNIFDTIVAY